VSDSLLERLTKRKLLEQRDVLAEAMETVRGDLYLHGLGEATDAECLEAIRETVDALPWFTHPGRRASTSLSVPLRASQPKPQHRRTDPGLIPPSGSTQL
jgi:hypothetical protein